MKCPSCEELLIMTERQSVEIDYCPKCRGVWLDKGELDKIIEKSTAAETKQQLGENAEKRKQYDDDDDDDDDDDNFLNRGRRNNNNENPNRRKGGFLSNLFDFD
ncbi:MAG: zf-TFIIB domain-containing protein [Chitinophagaceae bacterium]|nr:zf-TFIIB domain-containing protein [Chitinophagaceae bacterium]